MSKRARALLVAVAVVLLGAQGATAALVWQHTRPRLPPVAAATAALEQAIAAVVGAAGDQAAAAVSGLVPYTSCENTFLARGSRYNRSADLYTDPGAEAALIDRIAAHLPADDHPQRVAPTGTSPAPLTASFGPVQVRVAELGQGWVEAFAESACRGGRPPAPPRAGSDASAQATIAHLLGSLGTRVQSSRSDVLGCPAGRITTVSALSDPTSTDQLATRVAPLVPTGARQFRAPANRLSWRVGSESVVVAASDDGTHVTVQDTTLC